MSACNTEGYFSFYDLEIDPKAGTNFDWVSRLIFFSAIDIECDRIWRSLMHWNCDNLIAAAVAASAFTNYQLVKVPFRGRVKNSLFWGRLQKLWNFSENLLPTVRWNFFVTYFPMELFSQAKHLKKCWQGNSYFFCSWVIKYSDIGANKSILFSKTKYWIAFVYRHTK